MRLLDYVTERSLYVQITIISICLTTSHVDLTAMLDAPHYGPRKIQNIFPRDIGKYLSQTHGVDDNDSHLVPRGRVRTRQCSLPRMYM